MVITVAIMKLAKLGATALGNNFVRLRRPYKLTFGVTYNCNSKCLTCNIWNTKPRGSELTLQEIQEFARRNSSFRWISMTGGEPFLRSDIVAVLKAFYDSCKGLYLVTIPTNSLCPPDLIESRLEQMLNIGIPRIAITLSLDGYREIHDKIRGVPGNFDKVIELARRMRGLQGKYPGFELTFGYTMSRYNTGALEKTIEEVMKLVPGVTYNNFHINAGQVSGVYYKNESMELMGERETMAKELGAVIRKRKFELGAMPIIEMAFMRNLVKYIKTGKTPVRGKSLDASLFLDSYGNVYPSIMWGTRIGNIRETGYDLAPLWNNADSEEVRKLIREGKEPSAWTSCEAYQALVGNVISLLH